MSTDLEPQAPPGPPPMARKPFGVVNINLSQMPNLPGYALSMPKDRHHRKQKWTFVNGQRMEMTEGLTHDKPKFCKVPKDPPTWRDGETLPRAHTRDSFYLPPKTEESKPSWDANCGQVLRFFGFFREAVAESNLEAHRVRKITVYYYLEDDTMHVGEPSQENSGMGTRTDVVTGKNHPGVIIRRHRVPREDGEGDQGYFTPADLAVGKSITIYGKTFQLIDCDEFTRAYFGDRGTPLAPSEPCPVDQFTEAQAEKSKKIAKAPRTYEKIFREAMLGGGHMNVNMQQFMEDDRKVCRFYAVMDDTSLSAFERRPFLILFFLANNTMEIREMYPANCGRDNFPVFFNRARLRRGNVEVLGPYNAVVPESEYTTLAELQIGSTFRALNRDFLIYDADGYTRRYVQETMGVTLGDKIDMRLPEPPAPRPPTPPYTGFGSWEDSMGSVTSIVPKVPKKDFMKMAAKEGQVLRFTAKFTDPCPEDVDRRFVFNFYLFDDTVSIHEPPQRNLGIVTGKFLEQGTHLNQGTGTLFQPEHLLPGNTVQVLEHSFVMLDMDEYTRRKMQGYKEEYPSVDLNAILEKIRESLRQQFPLVRDVFRKFDTDKNGVLTFHEMDEMLRKFSLYLSETEVLALFRYFDVRRTGQCSYNDFCDAVLDADFTMTMLQQKDRLQTTVEPAYVARAYQKVRERAEVDAVRTAVQSISELLYKKTYLVPRLRSILYKKSGARSDQSVTVEEIRSALLSTGHDFSVELLGRAAVFVMPQTNLQRIQYNELLAAFESAFHECGNPR